MIHISKYSALIFRISTSMHISVSNWTYRKTANLCFNFDFICSSKHEIVWDISFLNNYKVKARWWAFDGFPSSVKNDPIVYFENWAIALLLTTFWWKARFKPHLDYGQITSSFTWFDEHGEKHTSNFNHGDDRLSGDLSVMDPQGFSW